MAYFFPSQFIVKLSQGRNQSRCQRIMPLLVCSPRLAQLSFLHYPGQPVGWHCSQWAGPLSVTNQENAPQTCPVVNLIEALFN